MAQQSIDCKCRPLLHGFNTGVLAARSTQAVIDLMEAWKAEQDAGRHPIDQDALNWVGAFSANEGQS